MAKIESIRMLWENVNTNPPDYKVSLDAADEAEGNADFLWNKVSPRNKVGISTELNTNKNLVPCELKNEKIVLSPTEESGSTVTEEAVIIVDSYGIISSTNTISLNGQSRSTMDYTCFPFQFSTGQIKSILVQQAQNSSYGNLSQVNIAIYANDVPGLKGSRLIWGSAGEHTFNANGELSFYDSTARTSSGPDIPGYTTIDGIRKQNTFFYVVFGALGVSDGGYKILGYRNSTGFDLIAKSASGLGIGKILDVQKTEPFHEIFDYEIVIDNSTLTIPYIAFEEIV